MPEVFKPLPLPHADREIGADTTSCRHQTSAAAGTAMDKSHMRLGNGFGQSVLRARTSSGDIPPLRFKDRIIFLKMFSQ